MIPDSSSHTQTLTPTNPASPPPRCSLVDSSPPSRVPKSQMTSAAAVLVRRRPPASQDLLQLFNSEPKSEPSRHDKDAWKEVTNYLDGKSLMRLGAVNRWFKGQIIESDEFDKSIWKDVCLRDLQVPNLPTAPSVSFKFKWRDIYNSAFGGRHSFLPGGRRTSRMRIGGFFFNSPVALVTWRLPLPSELPELAATPPIKMRFRNSENPLFILPDRFLVSGMRKGIWIADLLTVRCNRCYRNDCPVTKVVLDVRHAELFLEKGHKNGSWMYFDVGSDVSRESTAGMFDFEQITTPCISDLLTNMSWMLEDDGGLPKARMCLHGVVLSSNIWNDDPVLPVLRRVKFGMMRTLDRGEVVLLRISQHQFVLSEECPYVLKHPFV